MFNRNLIVVISWILNSCLPASHHQVNNYTRIKIIYKSPDYIDDDKEYWFDSEIFITYNGKYALYEIPYHKTFAFNNQPVYDSIKYDYFVCNDSTKKGYLLKTLGDNLDKEIASDSILASRAFNGDNSNCDIADSLKTMGEYKVIRVTTSEHQFIDKYYFLNHHFYDSAYLYYANELRNIKFSISKKLDIANKAKLIKEEFFIKHDANKTPEKFRNFYINSMEIQNSPAVNENEIKHLFERFIQREKIPGT